MDDENLPSLSESWPMPERYKVYVSMWNREDYGDGLDWEEREFGTKSEALRYARRRAVEDERVDYVDIHGIAETRTSIWSWYVPPVLTRRRLGNDEVPPGGDTHRMRRREGAR